MPIDAAARSLERTASILRPRAGPHDVADEDERDRRPRPAPSRRTASRAMFAALAHGQVDAEQLRVGDQVRPSADTICGLANTNFSSVSAAASVTTASWAPRMRSAGQADDDAGDRGDQRGEQHRDRERDVRRRTSTAASPAMPANAAWASEICPTMPVRTTSDRAMSAIARLVMTRSGSSPRRDGQQRRSRRRTAMAITTGRLRGRITGRQAGRVSSPRIGIELPSTNSVTDDHEERHRVEQALLGPLRPPRLRAARGTAARTAPRRAPARRPAPPTAS